MVYRNLFETKVKAKPEEKPDFLDLDKDGDTEEAMKKAAEEAEKTEKGEELEVATDEEIKKVVIDILDEEGGASGLDPIKVAVEKLNLPEDFNLEEFLDSLPDDEVKRHEEKDYIEMTGLKEENTTTSQPEE